MPLPETCQLCGRPIAPSRTGKWALDGTVIGDPFPCTGSQFGHIPVGEWQWLPLADGYFLCVPIVRLPSTAQPPPAAPEMAGPLAETLGKIMSGQFPGPAQKVKPEFSWDGQFSEADFEPAGTPCDGCQMTDRPVHSFAGRKMCFYCDELVRETPEPPAVPVKAAVPARRVPRGYAPVLGILGVLLLLVLFPGSQIGAVLVLMGLLTILYQSATRR